MAPLSFRLPLRTVVCATLLVGAACSDATAPGNDPALAPVPEAPSEASLLHSGKYRDSSAPHATGRSGSATLAALALIGEDGITRLLVTTGDVDDPGSAPGQLAKVQLKVYGPDGSLLFTQNHQQPSSGGSAWFEIPGLPEGSVIKVQANVRGIDWSRTDVVEISETVKPAAAFTTTLDAPDTAPPLVPTVITGTVTEVNGVMGGHTDCVLQVEGQEVDRIDDVWVDAGDEVTCAFTYTFPAPGEYDVSMVLEDGATFTGDVPMETVTVIDPTPDPRWSVSLNDRYHEVTGFYYYDWYNPVTGSDREYEKEETNGTHSQELNVSGVMMGAASFPLGVRMHIWSSGGLWQDDTWEGLTGVLDAEGRLCADRMVPEQGGHFFLCSTGSGATGYVSFTYRRFAGTVTYHSNGFLREWDPILGADTYWTWNITYETQGEGGQIKPLGSPVHVTLDINGQDRSFQVNASVPLAPYDNILRNEEPRCWQEQPYWLDGGTQNICERWFERIRGWAGEADG